MGNWGKRFSNQGKDEILKHLSNLLRGDKLYHLCEDPMRIFFEIRESNRPPKEMSNKQLMLKQEYANRSKKQRRLAGTRRRSRPKIRNAKKGRTVNLKGVSY